MVETVLQGLPYIHLFVSLYRILPCRIAAVFLLILNLGYLCLPILPSVFYNGYRYFAFCFFGLWAISVLISQIGESTPVLSV